MDTKPNAAQTVPNGFMLGEFMIKVLYLIAGILLKQTVDEIKFLVALYIEHLKKYRESLETYRPNPALQAGTKEASRAIREHEHRMSVEPAVEKISRKILILRCVPLVFYLLGAAALTIWILRLESNI